MRFPPSIDTLRWMTRGIASVVVLLCLLVGAAPAAAAQRLSILAFDVRSGSMSEVVSFQGDGGPACAQAGVCGYSGTVAYSFGGVRSGGGSVLLTRNGKRSSAFGFASLQLGALTTANVSAGPGTTACTEKILHQFDSLVLEGDARRLRVLFHPALAAPDFLETYCAGPSDSDISHAGVIPTLSIPTSSLRRRRFTLSVASTKPFHSGPFSGTVSFNATFVLSRVRIPGGLLDLFA
jgi:hypothetical protein